MDYVIPAPAQPSLTVVGSQARFPVHRIYCVGRNYAAHAREMGRDPDREPPFFFLKPADAVIEGGDVPYPPATSNLHYELEMVVAIGAGGADIPPQNALDHVYGYAVGLDLTRRDLQMQAREIGRPWDAAKSFDHSAPCSPIRAAGSTGHPEHGRIWLQVNGTIRQDSDIDKMIWSVPEIIGHLSTLFTLQPGDLIYSGTPQGVGAVRRGDRLRGGVEGVGEHEIKLT